MYKSFSIISKGAFGFILLVSIIVSSCRTTKTSSGYFETLKKDTTITGMLSPDLESKIRPGDNLTIIFKSLSIEENAKYNNISLTSGSAPVYEVYKDGTIKVNRLGVVKVEGLTRKELAKKLETAVEPYLKEPVVEVGFQNHRITVLGNVQSPQVVNMPQEQITLIDAIALCGDIKEDGSKKDIMVIREDKDQKIIKHINLENHSVFSSPFYYLQPNDIVYVIPDNSKITAEEKRRNLQTNLSLIASGVSLLVIIIDRIIR